MNMEKTNIVVERAKKKITQEELAKIVKVSRQTINMIEKGRGTSVSIAIKIANAFGRKVEDFTEFTKD